MGRTKSAFYSVFLKNMLLVLPGGIEPPTSSLPMKCSTPELRQHCRRGQVFAIAAAVMQAAIAPAPRLG